jgi:hypothetical protein
MLGETFFLTGTVLVGALISAACALFYFQRVRLERPAIGVFNFRDIAVLLFFILTLPLLYIVVPLWVVMGLLVLTFTAALYIALRPLLRPRYMWPLMAVLLATNVVVDQTMLGTQMGWQVYWVLVDIVVLIGVVGVANLYVQGGMSLRHVAWFALILAVYDGFFAFVVPISQRLADHFEGVALDPSIGFKMGPYDGNIGLGDLLVFCLFTVAAYKGFGRKGAIASFAIITIFGALIPGTSPIIIAAVTRAVGVTVPAQVSFGPVAYLTYRWLAHEKPERSMAEWFAVQAAMGHRTLRVVRRARPAAGLALTSKAEHQAGV